MDLRRLRFPEYDGDRITVRLRYSDRQQLRRIADERGTSESALVREAVSVLIEVLVGDDVPKPHPNSLHGMEQQAAGRPPTADCCCLAPQALVWAVGADAIRPLRGASTVRRGMPAMSPLRK